MKYSFNGKNKIIRCGWRATKSITNGNISIQLVVRVATKIITKTRGMPCAGLTVGEIDEASDQILMELWDELLHS